MSQRECRTTVLENSPGAVLIVGDPCIEGTLADVDPKAPGPQYDCQVSAVTGRGTPAESQTVLPRCIPEDPSAGNQPCWHLVTDPVSCPNSDHPSLTIEGQGDAARRRARPRELLHPTDPLSQAQPGSGPRHAPPPRRRADACCSGRKRCDPALRKPRAWPHDRLRGRSVSRRQAPETSQNWLPTDDRDRQPSWRSGPAI